MSRENEQWVWDHSPYSGGQLLLHLAMGDLANQENHNELWAGDDYLADKARISVGSVRRHRAQMVTDGYLEVIDAGGGRGRRHRVRLLKPAQSAHVSDEPKPAQLALETRADPTSNPRNDDSALLVNPREPKGTETTCDPMLGFQEFWTTYPRRNGKRLRRGKCEEIWAHLSITHRRAAWRGARNYAAACASGLTIAKDPERFLTHHDWDDWQDPAKPDAPTRPARGDGDPRSITELQQAARGAQR